MHKKFSNSVWDGNWGWNEERVVKWSHHSLNIYRCMSHASGKYVKVSLILLSLVVVWQINTDIKGFCLGQRYHCSVTPHLGLTRKNSFSAWAEAETKFSIGTSTKHLISSSLQLPLLCQRNKNEREITFPNRECLHKRLYFTSLLYIVSCFYSHSFHYLFSHCYFSLCFLHHPLQFLYSTPNLSPSFCLLVLLSAYFLFLKAI